MNYQVTFAQNREDLIIAEFLKGIEHGFYVDVGANDPDLHSVTKRFYMSGWHGINIEPSSKLYARLVQKRRRDINIKVGVGATNSEEKFREYPQGDGLSTFSEAMKEEYNKSGYSPTVEYIDSVLPIRTLATIFEEQSVPQIDFMKIDIEGYEYEAIIGNDWKRYRPKLLCIEANHIDKDWRPILAKYNYEKIFFDGLNEYYLAQEHGKLADTFSYPQAVLSTNYISPELHELLRKNEEEIRNLKQNLDSYYIQFMHASNHAAFLEKELYTSNQQIHSMEQLAIPTQVFNTHGALHPLKDIYNKLMSGLLLKKTKAKVTSDNELTLMIKNKHKLLGAIRAYDYSSHLFDEVLQTRRGEETQPPPLAYIKKVRVHARNFTKSILRRRER